MFFLSDNQHIHVKQNEKDKVCEIWVSSVEKDKYKNDPQYRNTIRHFKERGYSVCTFVGGDVSLIQNFENLLSDQ